MKLPGLHIVTTVPLSLHALLADQPRELSRSFAVTLIASPGTALDAARDREGVRTHEVRMTRSVTPIADLWALWRLYLWLRKERPHIVQSYTPNPACWR